MKGEISIMVTMMLAADHQRTGGWAKPDTVKKAFDSAILILREAQARDAQIDQMREEFRAADEAKYRAERERDRAAPEEAVKNGIKSAYGVKPKCTCVRAETWSEAEHTLGCPALGSGG